jgi:hypothetical protein
MSGLSEYPPPILIRTRVEEQPVPEVPSFEESCTACGAAVWTDQRTGTVGVTGTVVCYPCVIQGLEEITEEEPA